MTLSSDCVDWLLGVSPDFSVASLAARDFLFCADSVGLFDNTHDSLEHRNSTIEAIKYTLQVSYLIRRSWSSSKYSSNSRADKLWLESIRMRWISYSYLLYIWEENTWNCFHHNYFIVNKRNRRQRLENKLNNNEDSISIGKVPWPKYLTWYSVQNSTLDSST